MFDRKQDQATCEAQDARMKCILRLERAVFADGEWQEIGRCLRLSPREIQIVRHACEDRKELSIALALRISRHTVHTHLSRVYRKLGVSSRCKLFGVVVTAFRLLRGDRW